MLPSVDRSFQNFLYRTVFHVTYYPLFLQDYLVVGHTADQTRTGNAVKSVQGYRAMDMVDSDRAAGMRDAGFSVVLAKLTPEECSPKNNLLVGVRRDFFA